MAAGEWPEYNAIGMRYPADSIGGRLAGTALANGWKAMLCAVTGDLEFHASGYELQNPNSGGTKPQCGNINEEHNPKPAAHVQVATQLVSRTWI